MKSLQVLVAAALTILPALAFAQSATESRRELLARARAERNTSVEIARLCEVHTRAVILQAKQSTAVAGFKVTPAELRAWFAEAYPTHAFLDALRTPDAWTASATSSAAGSSGGQRAAQRAE